MYPVVTPGASPGLSQAVLAPSVVSPLAAQVYQVQQTMAQGLTTNNGELGSAVDLAGQSGPVGADTSEAAQVFPMAWTTGMRRELIPLNQRQRQQGPPRNPDVPGTPWGGTSVYSAAGGCNPGTGLSPLAKLFLLAGAGVVAWAIFGDGH